MQVLTCVVRSSNVPSAFMNPKDRILAAAADLFSRHGFRGATTRRIAQQAGVNEVTIFRSFGNKERLMAEAIHAHAAQSRIAPLPTNPGDPERELITWCSAQLQHLRRSRSLIRTCMGELEERPAFAPEAAHGPAAAREQLSSYLAALRAKNLIRADANYRAAVAMLLGACFADAMGREIMPEMFPQPAQKAAAEYTRLFLSALGYTPAQETADSGPRSKNNDARSPLNHPRPKNQV
jgi:AcrR family transcriptional regulator